MSILFAVATPIVIAVFAIQMEKFESFSTRTNTTSD
ncbi:hypothetical protein CKALI_10845 [Corynebacterium kalinowskii]|uniref:Uncharacterized protein n=1 Tax=Corynebacterium kalinowskii TaxID=2675216 RepID=A0A6B8VJ11_9CORY|nr:hypothetical protein CKALI_10845 [Corynebacterium kalinowskii]